jgi:hypothetical protein
MSTLDLFDSLPAPCAQPATPRCWLAVASAEHVAIGRAGGFMQVCHGKGGPLKRLAGGDRVVYYSPTQRFGERSPMQAFTAIGAVRTRAPYQADMGGGFHPFRRDVDWCDGEIAPIAPLLGKLDLSRGNRNWGYQLRFGLIELSAHDFELVAQAMKAQLMVVPA